MKQDATSNMKRNSTVNIKQNTTANMRRNTAANRRRNTAGITNDIAAVRICIFMLCLLMLYAACRVIGKVRDYHAAAEEYASLESTMACVTWEPIPEEDAAGVKPDARSSCLLEINPDYCAWFSMEEPEISYPVVQDAGDAFYLTHSFYGKENPSGCLFIDPSAAPDFSSLNTIIHGHNMRDGSMFGRLQLLGAASSRPDDPYFSLDVMGEKRSYRIFAIAIVPAGSSLYRIPSEASYDAYIEEIFGSTVLYADKDCRELRLHRPMVTLSTCWGAAGTDRRLLVVGVEIAQEKSLS